jgi:hypothetical protein
VAVSLRGCEDIEERPGSAGALRAPGVWGPCRGPHVLRARERIALSRGATAAPGGPERRGAWGAPGAPHELISPRRKTPRSCGERAGDAP